MALAWVTTDQFVSKQFEACEEDSSGNEMCDTGEKDVPLTLVLAWDSIGSGKVFTVSKRN